MGDICEIYVVALCQASSSSFSEDRSLNCSLLLRLQIGLLSPTKLRMKLLGHRNSARKGGSNSAKMSPSKNEDMKSARNNLLVGDIDNEGQ